jgi:hypothetical protein
MPQIVDTIDHITYHGSYLHNPDENTILVVYGGLVAEAAVISNEEPLKIARQLFQLCRLCDRIWRQGYAASLCRIVAI